ncbi:calcium-binding protein [Gemmobacter fulva]|nr:hypothetical protein [Gemmobacter fulvus]
MVTMTARRATTGMDFRIPELDLSELVYNADSLTIEDRRGSSLSGVALGDVINIAYEQGPAIVAHLFWNSPDLTLDRQGNLRRGTITDLFDVTETVPGGDLHVNMVMRGLSIDAAALRAASQSRDDQSDDVALMAKAFSGADVMLLTNYRDQVTGMAGNDRMLGFGGNDRLWGGSGADTLDGGTGADSLYGGAGRDTLRGSKGNDMLSGGSAADVFVFGAADGSDVLTDFRDGQDRIRITKGAAEFDDIRILIPVQGDAVVLQFAGTTLRVIGADAETFDAGDFLFA